MRVVNAKLLEDCLDKTIVKELHLSEPIDEPLMRRLAVEAKLQYFPDFPKPYFRIDRSGHYVIQGSVGNSHFRITITPSAPPDTEERLTELIEHP